MMSKKNQQPTTTTTTNTAHHHVYFSLGKLRFGHHGILATLALIVTVLAAYVTTTKVHTDTTIPTVLLVVGSMILTTLTALDARSLMSQVPIRSIIVPGVYAPHREAFRRTMSMMHYANVRILGELVDQSTGVVAATATTSSTTGSAAALFLYYYYPTLYKAWLCYMWTHFLPIHSPLDNGNTYIFVVPMFVGVSLDIYQTLCGASWETSINVTHYLLLQISALVIAFYFTLAFRGYFSVRQIYVASALMVAGIFGSGIVLMMTSAPSSHS